jgi:hypothetical protein
MTRDSDSRSKSRDRRARAAGRQSGGAAASPMTDCPYSIKSPRKGWRPASQGIAEPGG